MKRLSIGEETLALHLRAANIPFTHEFVFAPPRKWRFDFIIGTEAERLAVEIDGGTTSGRSRHSFGKGYENDCIKLNEAAIRGYRILRFTTAMVRSGEALLTIERARTLLSTSILSP